MIVNHKQRYLTSRYDSKVVSYNCKATPDWCQMFFNIFYQSQPIIILTHEQGFNTRLEWTTYNIETKYVQKHSKDRVLYGL